MYLEIAVLVWLGTFQSIVISGRSTEGLIVTFCGTQFGTEMFPDFEKKAIPIPEASVSKGTLAAGLTPKPLSASMEMT